MVCLWFITIVFLFYLFNLLYKLLYSIANLKKVEDMKKKINTGGGKISYIIKKYTPYFGF